VRKLWFVVACASLVSLVALFAFVQEHAYSLYDDAFIYLRYVKNVRVGCGLRFNCSEPPVEGFSSPLWLLLLVTGSQVTRKLVTLTQVLGTASMASLLVVAPLIAAQTHGDPRISWQRRGAAALLVAALLSFDHFVLLNAVIGLEGSLAATAVLLAYGAVCAERHESAVALVLASILLRPEAVTLLPALLVLPWARRRGVIGVIAGALVSMALARWLLFGDVMPNTMWAKAGGTARHVELGVAYVATSVQHFPAVLFAPALLAWRPASAHARFLLVGSLLWTLGLIHAGGDTFEYGRLLFPLVPALTVGGVQGALALVERVPVERRRAATHAIAGLFGILAARAAVSHGLAPSHGFQNVARWTATGQYLKAHYPKKRIATVPIGAIGYFSELELLDMVGLTSPAIAKAGRSVPPAMLTSTWIGHERHELAFALAWAPDLLLTTKFRSAPWESLDEASAGFYADWLFLDATKHGVAPYHVQDLEVAPGLHLLALARDDDPAR
jgi:hypothetical protein